jgi:hypothetical protein
MKVGFRFSFMKTSGSIYLIILFIFLFSSCSQSNKQSTPPKMVLENNWWQVAGNPDMGEYTTEGQEPVDFAIWQAADGTWQLWSCIRKTSAPGKTRIFHRWEGKNLEDTFWEPKGFPFLADTTLGETLNGLQAPYVIREADGFYMFYGDYNRICLAKSEDGKHFERVMRGGSAALFGEEKMTRDPMVLQSEGKYNCYYTANPDDKGAIYLRTASDKFNWSESRMVAFGGQAGSKFWEAECPFVVQHPSGWNYLLRTQSYGPGLKTDPAKKQKTSLYASRDLVNFGIDDDSKLLDTLEVAAPEIFMHNEQYYMAALMPDLQGIRISRLKWER